MNLPFLGLNGLMVGITEYFNPKSSVSGGDLDAINALTLYSILKQVHS